MLPPVKKSRRGSTATLSVSRDLIDARGSSRTIGVLVTVPNMITSSVWWSFTLSVPDRVLWNMIIDQGHVVIWSGVFRGRRNVVISSSGCGRVCPVRLDCACRVRPLPGREAHDHHLVARAA